MPLACPGFHKAATGTEFHTDKNGNLNIARNTAIALGINEAMKAFPNNQCNAPCISIPVPMVRAANSFMVAVAGKPGVNVALGWADWELWVQCIPIPAGGGPVVPPPLKPETMPGDIAPITPGTYPHKKKGKSGTKKR